MARLPPKPSASPARSIRFSAQPEDVTNTLDIAMAASGCDSAKVVHKPDLLSDNGSSSIAGDRAEYLDDNGMKPVRGAPMHPQTQGKIERWHQNARKHYGTKRRVWRKIHIGIDENTLEIRAAEFITSDVGDAQMLPELLDQIPPQ
jgi:transposase InsO family protein